ncbi:hypothetical protein BXZ70DRAFT_1061997 [Cristinia sonorae]|uniref:F-box domain-containing protein n=1 Tax=Cristinia sonorae TaxID=1940300 RepID=A0A8K0UXR6_9AGAR|nr:hypothetical protein BXZ70DRAFT_1061997 [Cristinia sonorae]
MVGFNDLPPELIEKILLDSDLQSVARCRQVSKQLNLVVSQSTAIQYKNELALDAFEDGPPSKLTPGERLDRLQRRRKAWQAMKPLHTRTFTGQTTWWKKLYGDHLIWLGLDGYLHVMQIPSVCRGIPEKEWTVDVKIAPEDLEDVLIDPAQDLLVISQNHGKLTLLSMTTGDAHPAARKAELSVDIGSGYSLIVAFERISVFGDYLGGIASLDHMTKIKKVFVLYEWKTGKMVVQINSTTQFGYAFLTENYLLFTYSSHDQAVILSVVDIHALHEEHGVEAVFLPYSPSVCRLQSPKLRFSPSEISIETSPSQRKLHGPSVPFYPSSTGRILAIVMHGQGESISSTFIVPLSTILGQFTTKAATGEQKRLLTWEEWSDSGCGLFIAPFGGFWTVSGMTTIMEGPSYIDAAGEERSERPDGDLSLFLYDFAPFGARKYCRDVKSGNVLSTMQYRDTFVHGLVGFGKPKNYPGPTLTKLPARRVEVPEGLMPNSNPSEVLIGDDCFVFVNEDRDDSDICEYEVMSF